MCDRTGNMPPLPGIFLDMVAPVVRGTEDGAREMLMMRWGFPSPPNMHAELVTSAPDEERLLAEMAHTAKPLTSIAGWTTLGRRPRTGLHYRRNVRCFSSPTSGGHGPVRAGRRKIRLKVSISFYSILTTGANDLARPTHSQAMLVILTTPKECETWMTAPMDEALTLQRPLPNDALTVVASGEKKDRVA
jgi:putative SOS response-associated peptidase YedK